MSGRVDAVCIVHADLPSPRPVGVTSIDKRPRPGRHAVDPMGLVDDHVCDTDHHGGVDQAVYAYAEEEAARWSSEIEKPVPAGWFGENLRVSGIAVTDAVIGQRWHLDNVVLEVTAPRIPCATFQRWTDEEHWVRRFTLRSDVGAYLRVVEPGTIGAGDTIDIGYTPEHGVTVRDLFVGTDLDRLIRLETEPSLSAKVRGKISHILERAGKR
ncbi:MOSC domain-containing protein [Antrihabitans stalactiti]|uniref:MOSC domain-containing protein n=1 Tax=Antrihabitans stalactiti TaxID=2584121 RepID=A0A848KH78_9NOCA|nr:MOSC domain-containing protein [Antrihabitans stalactiti]NMN97126.1 MOSC domain-containing protein [Antrihabitans stalactiti]